MNAPAKILRPKPTIVPAGTPGSVRFDENPVERAYRRAISIHRPNDDEMAMAARVDIAIMRDHASAGAQRACDSAAILLNEVTRVASGAVYADIGTKRLLHVRAALQITFEAARALERALSDGR